MKTSDIFEELKRRIVFFDYKPKQVLSVKELSKEFGVSAIPIRETLIRLEEEKLIVIIPNNIVYVSDLSFQELKDVFEVRLFLLGMVGKLASKRAKREEIEEMKLLAEKMKTEKNRKKIIQLDAQFHDLFNKSTGNEVLAETLEKLRNRLGRLWYLAEKGESYSLQIPGEIDNLITALESRDGEKCKQILEEHVIHFIERIKINLYNGYPI
ncbi:MAG TPA: GntR family transcriptional regulator [Atribacterota bacterium]|nr:GntR family transcriptional regulator [Atribacterota bacterium]